MRKPCSEETKKKISESHKKKGELHWAKRPEVRAKFSSSHKGKIHAGTFKKGHGKLRTDESYKNPITREKIRLSKMGEGSYFWKGGISKMPGYSSFNAKRRKILKRNAEGSHTLQEWLNLKAWNAYLCVSCGNIEPNIKLTEDHIIPLSKGGSDYIENIQPMCFSCNVSKHQKTINYLKVETSIPIKLLL